MFFKSLVWTFQLVVYASNSSGPCQCYCFDFKFCYMAFKNHQNDRNCSQDKALNSSEMSKVPHYLRLKPRGNSPEARDAPYLIETQDEHYVKFKDTNTPNKFTKIFNDISQLDLYNAILQDLTHEMLENKDAVFFTLGPSNSGKSYSIYGDDSNPGIAIYCLNEIFTKINSDVADYEVLRRHFGESFVVSSKAVKNCTGQFGVSISVYEIYNDRIRDLTQDSSKTVNQNLDIITDAKDGKIKPSKVRQIFVANLDEAKLVLHKSIKRRAVSSTNLNQKSSRSHLFIYFNLHKVAGRSVKTSRLTIADLAGSERTKSAKTEGKEFKEGNYTNTSLTELGRCLALMKSKKFDRSLLRTNKLTRLLLTDLFGNFNQNKMKILLTLDPYSILSTIMHALRYIQPVSKVTITSERNSLEPDSEKILQLNEEIRVLKDQKLELTKENEKAKQRLAEQELEIRQELSDEFERKIEEMDLKNSEELNGLKDQHQASTDQRLDLLSKDYEAKLLEQENDFKKQLDDLTKKYEDVETKYKELLLKNNDSQLALTNEHQDQVSELQQKISDLEKKLDITKKKEHGLETELSDAQKEIKHLLKKDKKKTKKIEGLNEQLEAEHKRKADSSDEEVEESNKRRKSEDFDKIELKPFSEEEEEVMSFSPIKLYKSPSKKSKSPTKSPSKKKKSFESPKKQPLQETIFDNTLPSPKIKVKSPSKGKKKLKSVRIVDESFSE